MESAQNEENAKQNDVIKIVGDKMIKPRSSLEFEGKRNEISTRLFPKLKTFCFFAP